MQAHVSTCVSPIYVFESEKSEVSALFSMSRLPGICPRALSQTILQSHAVVEFEAGAVQHSGPTPDECIEALWDFRPWAKNVLLDDIILLLTNGRPLDNIHHTSDGTGGRLPTLFEHLRVEPTLPVYHPTAGTRHSWLTLALGCLILLSRRPRLPSSWTSSLVADTFHARSWQTSRHPRLFCLEIFGALAFRVYLAYLTRR